MYHNNVIESNTNLSEEIFENFVWPQESYLTSVPTTFVRGPEVYSVESAGNTYFFQTAVPVNSVSFENPVWPQDSYLPPVPTNCFFVRGPDVYSIEAAGTTYYYQRAVPVSIVRDLDFHLHNDGDQEYYPVSSENTDLLNDEINNYDIVNSSASSLSLSVYTDTGHGDSDLESSDSSYKLHVTDNLATDVQQNGNVLDWSIIDETLSEFCEDNNVCIENCNDGSSENFGTDVQQNGNVLDWSVIDETLSEFYEDNNACIENCNDGSSENNVEGYGNYAFGYDIKDGLGATNSRSEVGDGHGNKKGSYTLADIDGRTRKVEYIADGHGFRATIKTNEPGIAASAPAAAIIASPYAAPVAPVAHGLGYGAVYGLGHGSGYGIGHGPAYGLGNSPVYGSAHVYDPRHGSAYGNGHRAVYGLGHGAPYGIGHGPTFGKTLYY